MEKLFHEILSELQYLKNLALGRAWILRARYICPNFSIKKSSAGSGLNTEGSGFILWAQAFVALRNDLNKLALSWDQTLLNEWKSWVLRKHPCRNVKTWNWHLEDVEGVIDVEDGIGHGGLAGDPLRQEASRKQSRPQLFLSSYYLCSDNMRSIVNMFGNVLASFLKVLASREKILEVSGKFGQISGKFWQVSVLFSLFWQVSWKLLQAAGKFRQKAWLGWMRNFIPK
jgi:hypothetical protein